MTWAEEKKTKQLNVLCRHCKQPSGWHGASDGQCPKRDTKFIAFKDRRTSMPVRPAQEREE